MKGLDEAENLFFRHGLEFFRSRHPEIFPRLAFGLAGHGSECFGFDDEISRDHDFTRGFAVWITAEDEARHGFELQRSYFAFLKEHFPETPDKGSKLGESEHGICRIGDFFERHIGIPRAPQDWREWLYTPEYAFAEAVNGRVFLDNSGVFSSIRKQLADGMPEDVRLKKLAARAAVMAQSGQYNYLRCHRHGEPGAAGIALADFVKNCVSFVFLLNRRYCPYYKWMFRAMRDLPVLGELVFPLEFLLDDPAGPEEKQKMIEDICFKLTEELRRCGLSSSGDAYLEAHAFAMMKKIRNEQIRSLHIMEG